MLWLELGAQVLFLICTKWRGIEGQSWVLPQEYGNGIHRLTSLKCLHRWPTNQNLTSTTRCDIYNPMGTQLATNSIIIFFILCGGSCAHTDFGT